MRRFLAVLALLLLPACHDHAHGGPSADEFVYDCENKPAGEVAFASDESFRAFVDREAGAGFVPDDARAPRLTSPAPGAMLSATTPPRVSFQAAQAARGAPDRSLLRPVPRSRWARVRAWLSPVGTAYAHCPAVNGDNFLLRFSDAESGAPAYTAVLSVTSFTPDATKWKKAMQARQGKSLKLTLARATFMGGRITVGPFVPTVAPMFSLGP